MTQSELTPDRVPDGHLPESASGVGLRHDFESVYAEHFDFVWRGLRRLGLLGPEIDDAAQDVFLVVHRRLNEFEGRSSLRSWLFGIAIRVARAHRRKRQPGGAVSLERSLPCVGATNPFDRAARSEAHRTLHAVLDQLDETKRVVFVLTELEEMTGPEIASALGVNVNTVYSRLRSARAEFKRALERIRAAQRGKQRKS